MSQGRPDFRRLRRATAAAAAVALLAGPAWAEDRGPLRVGTSGDYAPFSFADSELAEFDFAGAVGGFDIALARAYARDRGRELVLVRFRWPYLEKAVAAGRFDVAMSGVTIRPERSVIGTYTVPVAETRAVVLVRHPELYDTLDSLNRPKVRIGVNAGGHLERLARARFPHATLVAIPDNSVVPQALADGSVLAALADSLEAPRWMKQGSGWGQLGPISRDRKAFLVRADRPELAADLDVWLLARERDGTLTRLRRRHLGEVTGPVTATPVAALLAAIDERLSLMPVIGMAKRQQAYPIEDLAREEYVIDAALASVRRAAQRQGRREPPEEPVRELFEALIHASKQIQLRAVHEEKSDFAGPIPDFASQLRPALVRIGDRIARLLVTLPEGLGEAGLLAETREALRSVWLDADSQRRIAEAIARTTAANDEAARAVGAR